MKTSILSFSRRGEQVALQMKAIFEAEGHEVYLREKEELSTFVETSFKNHDILLFVGACGIAVRLIAPHLESKLKDPAVIVMDENKEHVISLLSGHVGGANQWTRLLSEKSGARAVITTATDLQGRFAVDSWAVKQGLTIANKEAIVKVASRILEGEDIGFQCRVPWRGTLPQALHPSDEADVVIDVREPQFGDTLHLIPKALHLGLGCKRHTPFEQLKDFVFGVLREHRLSPSAVKAIHSIDLKSDEEGMLALAKKLEVPIYFHQVEELREKTMVSHRSEFVEKIIGIDNLCERAAQMGSEQMIVFRQASQGMTLAISIEEIQLEETWN